MKIRRLMIGLFALAVAVSGAVFPRIPSNAAPARAENPPPGPDRFTTVPVDYTAYRWYLRAWKGRQTTCQIVIDYKGPPRSRETYQACGEVIHGEWLEQVACNPLIKGSTCWVGFKSIACEIIVDHEGVPKSWEIYRDCGETIGDEWLAQPSSCVLKNKRECEGYYLHFIDKQRKQKTVSMELEPAEAWISLEDCHPVISSSTNICETEPTLVITGKEPLPNESITRVEGTYNGEPFSCADTDVCKFHLVDTGAEGATVEFWAYSTYGDSSIIYTAQVRAQQTDEGDPDQLYWYVDILSSQWQGDVAATCAEAWAAFPPVGGSPDWLSTPTQSENLSSDIPYTYLAAQLILQGAVDASACADGGISPGGVANQCGLEASRPAVIEWQNQFDGLILSVAQETNVPARLLKNLFARESQFWPGIYDGSSDVGLGQLTEDGADTTLFWNSSFYEQFCPLALPAETCAAGYMHLAEADQIELRRALLKSINATCEDCPLGLDLNQADYSVSVFAHTMIANCQQAGQVVANYTSATPGDVATFEDLWKFSLVNYNAGGGCLAEAITHAQGLGLELTWDNVSPHLIGACKNAVKYVNDISK